MELEVHCFEATRHGANTGDHGDATEAESSSMSAVPFTHVFSPAPTLAGSWTTFTGTFTIPAVDVSEGISFLIETVCGGAAGCSVSANIDNVTVTLNP